MEEVNVHHLVGSILDLYGEGARVDGMAVNFSQELMGTAGGVKRLADRGEGAIKRLRDRARLS